MIRRVLVIGGIGLALAGGARFAWTRLTELRWEAREGELAKLALAQPAERRPYEVRFGALAERTRGSKRFEELTDSPHRPYVTWGNGEPRALDTYERLWVESVWGELEGLDSVLAELRGLPLEALEWHGDLQKLYFLIECTNVLCARAWLALEEGDNDAAAEAYGDALRLARATDDGSTFGAMIRIGCDGIALRALRAGVGFGFSPSVARAALEPLLADWAYDPERAERCIRRDLCFPPEIQGADDPRDEPAFALAYFAPVERAIALAHQPLDAFLRESELVRAAALDPHAPVDALDVWSQELSCLRALHSQGNVALTALAVGAHEELYGSLPASLDEVGDLQLEHSVDPLTGQRLPYALTDTGARIGPAAWSERVDRAADTPDSLYSWTLR